MLHTHTHPAAAGSFSGRMTPCWSLVYRICGTQPLKMSQKGWMKRELEDLQLRLWSARRSRHLWAHRWAVGPVPDVGGAKRRSWSWAANVAILAWGVCVAEAVNLVDQLREVAHGSCLANSREGYQSDELGCWRRSPVVRSMVCVGIITRQEVEILLRLTNNYEHSHWQGFPWPKVHVCHQRRWRSWNKPGGPYVPWSRFEV